MQTKKPKTSRSLAATLASAFLGLTLVALFIAYIPQLFFFIRTGNQAIAGEQQLIAKEAANTVVSFIEAKFGVLETAARLGYLISTSRENQKEILASLLGSQPAFRQLAFLDAQGWELVRISRLSKSTSGDLIGRAGSGWLEQVARGERYIGPIYVDEATSEPLLVMAVPARDVFGDFRGVLLAEVNLKFMWDLVGALKVGETGLAYVVDRQGNLIAFGDVSRVLQSENVSRLDLVAKFVADPVPAGEAVTGGFQGINGFRVIGTYVSLGVPDWAVVTELPVQEGTASLIRSILASLGVMVIVAVVVARVAVYIARRLAVPLLNLTTTAGRIAGGELNLQAALQGPSEVVDLARAFNTMTAQLRETLTGLEQRVAERTQGLLTAAEVSSATAAVLDLDKLLPQIVELVRERFQLYYVGLFLTDEAGEYAVLRAGTGEAGRAMLARQHRLRIGGDSMIGRCVLTGQADIQLDVGEAAVHFSNPDLPDTRSELALPLRAGDQIIGAMTVQSEHEAFFSQADVSVMQTVADQVANAVRNARLFQQLQASLEAERRAYGELASDAWRSLLQYRSELGFVSDGQKTVQRADVWRPEMETALHTAQVVPGQGDAPTVAIPIKVRDQVIGVVDGCKPDGSEWTQEEIDMLSALTEQLNVALESARLYQDTQRRATRERMIGEVTGRIRETLNVEAVLKTAVDEIRQALQLERLVVRLGTPDEDTVQPAEKGYQDVEQD
ncbi:MAG TPA: GAF domain-containing protein [Anaerolineae bacterium]|nr:GAF domain-containing protein [Anaerolineae bacterium]HQH37066.1 GAF domain-containing protein [Anaerolineae bacterium]